MRTFLIALAAILVIRYLYKIIFPRRRNEAVRGQPRRDAGRIEKERIQDASFKDISEK